MDEFNNLKILENYISWIDAIVSLCRNLDQACTNLDQDFPSEINSSRLLSYLKVKRDYSNIFNSTCPSESGKHINSNINYTNINDDYYNPKQTILTNYVNNNLTNDEVVNINNISYEQQENVNKNKTIINHEKDFYGLIIKGFRTNEIYTPKKECIYNLESDIMKKLPVGERMCVIKKTSGSEDIALIKYTNDFDYLLDKPFEITPNKDSNNNYKCSVSGVYWDKRSWIASWYKGGRRFYKSFSSKLYGFYRSKYFAIHTRLHNSPMDNINRYTHHNET